uniref:Uncharacterized protein n=1 Tax=Oryza barthii TaxID=65489 RepID=A0A0D3HCR8_9ORYZ
MGRFVQASRSRFRHNHFVVSLASKPLPHKAHPLLRLIFFQIQLWEPCATVVATVAMWCLVFEAQTLGVQVIFRWHYVASLMNFVVGCNPRVKVLLGFPVLATTMPSSVVQHHGGIATWLSPPPQEVSLGENLIFILDKVLLPFYRRVLLRSFPCWTADFRTNVSSLCG